MKELKYIIADNLMNLRKANKLTQMELAEKLNYSDKAISKWERGESLPDIILLKDIATMYNVDVNYMLEEHTFAEAQTHKTKNKVNNKLIITLLSCLVVWLLATVLYVNIYIIENINYWLIWLWAIPITSIVLIVFSSIWGKKKHILLSVTIFVWTLLGCFYLQFIQYNLWSLFIVGAPLQLAIILTDKIRANN